MRQSAWLKRRGFMLRPKRPLVKLPYLCTPVSSNHTHETDRRNQMNQIPATRRKWFWHIFSLPQALDASTLNDTNQNHHDCDDQEGMNEAAHGVRADKPQNPEDNQDDCDGFEHSASPFE